MRLTASSKGSMNNRPNLASNRSIKAWKAAPKVAPGWYASATIVVTASP